MSFGGNGDFGGFDLGFEVPEARQIQEKLEEVVPANSYLANKVEQEIKDQIEDVQSVLSNKQLKIVGTMAAAMGDASDRQARLNSKVTPIVNQQLSEAQVPGLMVIREKDHVFDALLGDKTELINQVVERIPQWRALLLWTWKNEVKPNYPNLAKKDFAKAGNDIWEAAIQKAKSGGVRNIASEIKKAEALVQARQPECDPGEQWIEADDQYGDGYCTPVSDPEGDQPPIQPEVTGAEGEPGVQGEPFVADIPVPIQTGKYCVGTAAGFTFTDVQPRLEYQWMKTGTGQYEGYFQKLGKVYICQGDVPVSILPKPPPGYKWVNYAGTDNAYVQQNRTTMRIINESTGHIAHVESIELPFPCPQACMDQPVTEPEPIPTIDTPEPVYQETCPPVSTPCVAVNCVTGIEPQPVPLPLDCKPGDADCPEEEEDNKVDPCEDAETYYVFYSTDDQGCYYRCDNANPIRVNDTSIGAFATKAEADQAIVDQCQSKQVPEIYYPGETPRPYAQPTEFPNIQESYFCEIAEWVNKFIEPILLGRLEPNAQQKVRDALSFLGINKSGRVPFMDNAISGVGGIAGAIGSVLNNVLQAIYVGMATGVVRLIEWIGNQRACFSTTWTGNFVMWFVWGLLAQYAGPAFGQLAQQSQYRVQAECPQLMPEMEQAITMSLAGKITEKETMALTRLNNYCFEPIEKLIAARETQYTTNELLMLRMRGQLDEKEFRYEVRRNGMRGADVPDKLWDLHRAIPPISDLVRFMVRDVADDKIAAKYGWDDFFTQKWTGDVKRWSDEQGVNEYIAKAYWRAHWQMPAPSQLFEMMHRLSRLPKGDPAYTDMATIDEAMRVNDWPDYWIDRFKAISYRRLTRVDIRRAYMIGSIGRAEVVEGYQQLGYDNKNANVLADFAESLLINRLEKSRDVKLYKQGVIDKGETKKRLVNDGASPLQADKIIKDADDELTAKVKETCASSEKKRFLEGTIDEATARINLLALPINLERTNQLIELWKCELKSVDKKPTTSRLCKFKEQGLINDAQFTDALKNLGWDAVEIANIIKSCDIDINAKQQRAIDKAARQADALARRNQADQRRKQNAAKAELKAKKAEDAKAQAKSKRTQKAQEAAIKANLRRQSVLIKAADKVADIYSVPLDDALYTVNFAWREMKRLYNFDSNKATEAIKVGVQALPKKDPPEFLPHMQTIAEGFDVIADG